MKKKISCLLLVVLLLSLVTAGCGKSGSIGKNDPIIQKWNYVGIEYKGEPADYETILQSHSKGDCLTVNEDGTFVLKFNGKNHAGKMTKESDATYTYVFDDKNDKGEVISGSLSINNDTIRMTLNENITFVLAVAGSTAESDALNKFKSSGNKETESNSSESDTTESDTSESDTDESDAAALDSSASDTSNDNMVAVGSDKLGYKLFYDSSVWDKGDNITSGNEDDANYAISEQYNYKADDSFYMIVAYKKEKMHQYSYEEAKKKFEAAFAADDDTELLDFEEISKNGVNGFWIECTDSNYATPEKCATYLYYGEDYGLAINFYTPVEKYDDYKPEMDAIIERLTISSK